MNDIESKVQQFHRDGYLVLPGILPSNDVARLREGVEAAFEQPCEEAALYNMPEMWRPKMFERGEAFEQLVDHPATIDLVEAILGSNCHLIAMSALRTSPNTGIDFWHADEAVRFPIPREIQLDERIQMPCFIVNLNYYLCDVDANLGPTQFVPGSHRAGRQPADEDRDPDGNPSFEGQGVVNAIGPAGTCVMWHDQVWHRGSKNLSEDRIRLVQQAPYGRRFISQRFYPFIKYRMPEEILERANPRRQRLLGMHEIGAYG